MHLDEEFRSYLRQNLSGAASNHADVLFDYFGLSGLYYPKLKQVGDKYGITKQAVDEIKKKWKHLKPSTFSLPTLAQCGDILQERRFWPTDAFEHRLRSENLISTETTARAVLLILTDCWGHYSRYGIYSPSLEEDKKSAKAPEQPTCIIREDYLGSIKDARTTARGSAPDGTDADRKNRALNAGLYRMRSLPGRLSTPECLPDLEWILTNDRDCIIIDADDEQWYAWHDRTNTILNRTAKLASLPGFGVFHIDKYSKILANALKARTYRDQPFPPGVIAEYVRRSQHFSHDGDLADFEGNPKTLSEVEQDAVEFLQSNGSSNSTELKQYLHQRGYKWAQAQKIIFTSEIIEKDTSDGRRNYVFKLPWIPQSSDYDRDKYYQTRLAEVCANGSDKAREHNQRLEQQILREWLLGKGVTVSECGICGLELNVQALVAAHKKPRSICSETERQDKHIIMPMCKFGCDYLYEMDFIRIRDGQIVQGDKKPLSARERDAVETLAGKRIAEKWLQGPPSYFER